DLREQARRDVGGRRDRPQAHPARDARVPDRLPEILQRELSVPRHPPHRVFRSVEQTVPPIRARDHDRRLIPMAGELSIRSAFPDQALLDLPWRLPLELWPEDTIAALPKGISRHLVRFVHLGEHVIAVKETTEELAEREYELLRSLQRLDLPSVEPVAVITDRVADDGEQLAPVLVTRHLRFSLPYRALFSQALRPDTATRLVDALAVLLARLHLAGFFWGDVSLSNTLFRRDAGAFAAYLVDA